VLYVTTRDKTDSFTAQYTLSRDYAPDGGLFVPFQLPLYTKAEINALREKSYGQIIADILNLFFSARIDGWDVDFCIGRYPAKLVSMSHRITVAETWHNPDQDFARVVRNLTGRIRGTDDTEGIPTNWAKIAVRIAMLFGLFGELERIGLAGPDRKMDIAVTSGDFSVPMAAFYARKMGLPVGTIICCCNENSNFWDFLYHGQLHTNIAAVSTNTPDADVTLPLDLERLIFSVFGRDEIMRFRDACNKAEIYTLDESKLTLLREGLFSAVVSGKRMESVIHNVYKTSTYLLDPYAALAYGGLQDYRASCAETSNALIISERSPLCSSVTVAKAMGITIQELAQRIKTS